MKIPKLPKKVQYAQYVSMQKQRDYLAKRVETLTNLAYNGNSIKDVGIEFQTAMKDLDMQQATGMFVWDGLPDNLQSWVIEQMLYYNGSLCGFFQGGTLYILPYAQRDGINVYGLPNAVQPITYNGAMQSDLTQNFGGKLLVNNNGKLTKDASAVLLYDRSPKNTSGSCLSPDQINDIFTKAQADVLGRIKANLQNSAQKVVFWVDDDNQKRQLTEDLENAYGSSLPFVVAVRGATAFEGREKGNAETLQGNVQNETQALFEAYQSYNSIRLTLLGIANGGAFEKKERKISAEAENMEQQTKIVAQNRLAMRKLFIEQLKLVYPQYADVLGKINVYIRGSADDPEVQAEMQQQKALGEVTEKDGDDDE